MSDLRRSIEILTADIERLQKAKRAALAVADERAKENVMLRKGIQDYLDGNYENPRRHRKDGPHETCGHGQFYWQPCEACIDDHFKALLHSVVGELR